MHLSRQFFLFLVLGNWLCFNFLESSLCSFRTASSWLELEFASSSSSHKFLLEAYSSRFRCLCFSNSSCFGGFALAKNVGVLDDVCVHRQLFLSLLPFLHACMPSPSSTSSVLLNELRFFSFTSTLVSLFIETGTSLFF